MDETCGCCGAEMSVPQVGEVQKVPWSVRWEYAMRALRGRLRPVGPVDVSHLESEGWMEGRVRVQVRG